MSSFTSMPTLSDETKEKLYKRMLTILAWGASLIVGLLSFGGMYAMFPLVIPSIISAILATIYEGEIFSQNLARAFEKIKNPAYFEKQLPKYYLERYFQDSSHKERPKFFREYEKALRKGRIAAITLDQLEDLFDEQMNAGKDYLGSASPYKKYAAELHAFLHKPKDDGTSIHEDYIYSKNRRTWLIPLLKFFGLGLTSLFATIATSYLLVELVTLIPLLAVIPFSVLPVIIIPLSLIAGVAYGGLTFNALTNLMANDTFLGWWRRIKHDFSLMRDDFKQNGFNVKHALKYTGMVLTIAALSALTVTLTVCTAGTWYTIARTVRPLFGWMKFMPAPIMQIINPFIMWVAAFAFNVENTSGTLHELFPEPDPKIKPGKSMWQQVKEACQEAYTHLKEKENLRQNLNPARMLLVVVLSLRYVFFLGHLLSIGVTADRIPTLSQYVSAGLGGLGEGTEDWHYFFKHAHLNDLKSLLRARLGEAQGHDHGAEDEEDKPTKLVNWMAKPLYILSAMWDAHYSQYNDNPEHRFTYEASLERQNKPFLEPDCGPDCNDCTPTNAFLPQGFSAKFPTMKHTKPVVVSVETREEQTTRPEDAQNSWNSGCSVM
jgi:hypothetical protein